MLLRSPGPVFIAASSHAPNEGLACIQRQSRRDRFAPPDQLQPEVAPQVLHFMQVPLRTSV